jgi:hypothetical protein
MRGLKLGWELGCVVEWEEGRVDGWMDGWTDMNRRGQKALRYGKPIWVNRTRYWLVESADVVCSMSTILPQYSYSNKPTISSASLGYNSEQLYHWCQKPLRW